MAGNEKQISNHWSRKVCGIAFFKDHKTKSQSHGKMQFEKPTNAVYMTQIPAVDWGSQEVPYCPDFWKGNSIQKNKHASYSRHSFRHRGSRITTRRAKGSDVK